MATSPPAGWYADPDGSGGQRYWDSEGWTKERRAISAGQSSRSGGIADGVRRVWSSVPLVLRLILPIMLALTLIGYGLYSWLLPPQRTWQQLPKRLSCQLQAGVPPPPNITVVAVDVSHPRSSVLRLLVHFAKPLPPSPSGSPTVGFAGYILNFIVANNGNNFAELGPQESTSDLTVKKSEGQNSYSNMRSDIDTHGRRADPDTLEINLELARFTVDQGVVNPELTLSSQFNTPSVTTVVFASQVCRAA